jgi:FtsP/CotA-like multicopper oxidase with cupredoxin domain
VYEYEYNIPVEHPAGTFWYHPHVHGSTAIQVGSGMAGALIVRGSRWPMIDAAGALRTGDIDVLLRHRGKPIPDRVLLLQQIQYACHGNADGDDNKWTCAPGERGEIRDYTDLTAPPANNWTNSGRFTTVNGRVSGVLDVRSRVGVPERWRFIHAGFSNPVGVQVFRRREAPALAAGTPDVFEKIAAHEQDAAIRRECLLDEGEVPLFEIAADGLTRPKALQATQRILHPGYRSDVLVSFPKAGDYCVIDNQTQEAQPDGTLAAKRRLLFTVKVLPGASGAQTNPKAAITAMLVNQAKAATGAQLTPTLKGKILGDLQADLVLDAFSPHATLAQAQVNNYQHVRFTLASAVQSDASDVPPGLGIGHVRVPAPADPANPPAFGELRFSDNPADTIDLYLGDVDEWRLTTKEPVGHPFHIHVNPFEVMAVLRRVEGAAEPVDLTLDPASQYFGMKGVFKDTIFVEPNAEVVVRSHYERYIGKFVLHCHILYHEDMGMMRMVEIHDPVRPVASSAQEGAAGGHAGHGVRH